MTGASLRLGPGKKFTNLSFCYPEYLSLNFELFQYDELRYCSESTFEWKKTNFSVPGKSPNFSMRRRLRLRTRGKLMLANFRLKIRAV